MLQKIMEVSTGVYILWGLGVLGILMKILANAYMRGMVRASEKLGDTNRKKLRTMRQTYENKRSFGLCVGDEESYAESFVKGLRFLTRPMEFWNRSGTVLSLVVCGLMAGAYIYYGKPWHGSEDMSFFFANSIIVCACLLALDNILLINNKIEILKANIKGYMERLPKPREETAGVSQTRKKEVNREPVRHSDIAEQEAAQTVFTDGTAKNIEEKKPEEAPEVEKESAAGEETLNRFLAEFFSG